MSENNNSNCSHDCNSCGESCSSRNEKPDFRKYLREGSSVKKVIGVVSGKGGVGKSMVTSLLAVAANNMGLKTAILDSDITGPSIPKAFGLKEGAASDGESLWPATSKKGIDMISMNLLLENETDPVLWRGPVIAGTVTQFWTEVNWKDIDVMFVDMPPGTSDVALTVYQSLPLDGVIIVTTPQELVSMIVAKSVSMAEKMNIDVLGLVQNMSYFKCDECKKKHYIFGNSDVSKLAAQFNIKEYAELELDNSFAGCVDEGRVEDYTGDNLEQITRMLKSIL